MSAHVFLVLRGNLPVRVLLRRFQSLGKQTGLGKGRKGTILPAHQQDFI